MLNGTEEGNRINSVPLTRNTSEKNLFKCMLIRVTAYFSHCNGLTECPNTSVPFIMMQQGHFLFIQTAACSCSQTGQIHA